MFSRHLCPLQKLYFTRIVFVGLLITFTMRYNQLIQDDFFQQRKQLINETIQREILNKTSRWRHLTNICYNGYCGPWIEEYYFEYFLKTNPKTERLYLPISWTNCHIYCTEQDKEALRKYVLNLDPNYKYFSVLQIDKGFGHPSLQVNIPDSIDMLLFSAGGYTSSKKITNVPIPLLKAPLQKKPNTEKLHIASFVGSLASHPLRYELDEKFRNLFYFGSTQDWESVMDSSFYSLCPRGYGATSFRLYEALQLESVPIYVWEEELLLPFSEVIDWSKISIIVHRSEINSILLNVLERNYSSFITEIKRVKHYFSYSFTADYINQIIQDKI